MSAVTRIPADRICRRLHHDRSWTLGQGQPVVCATCSPAPAGVDWQPVEHPPALTPEEQCAIELRARAPALPRSAVVCRRAIEATEAMKGWR